VGVPAKPFFVDVVTPLLQFAALVIGVLIGALTLRLKLMEYNEKKVKQIKNED